MLVTPITFGLIHEAYRGALSVRSRGRRGWRSSGSSSRSWRSRRRRSSWAPRSRAWSGTSRPMRRSAGRSGGCTPPTRSARSSGHCSPGLVLIELVGLSGALAIGAGGSLPRRRRRARPVAPARDGRRCRQPPNASPPAALPRRSERHGDRRRSARVRLALAIAFISGITSLGYQVTWTRLLASGTGNTTYVFTVILATFLTGTRHRCPAVQPVRSALARPDPGPGGVPDRSSPAWPMLGLGRRASSSPEALDPSKPLETLGALARSAFLVVLPVTIVLGIAFPTASALLRDVPAEAGNRVRARCSPSTRQAPSSAAWSSRSCSCRCSARRPSSSCWP